MSGLDFAVVGARADPAGAAPTIQVALRITAPPQQQVQSILLRCQIRVEPARRRYDEATQERLIELFGEPHRWIDTLKPFQLTHVTLPVHGFTDSAEVDLPLELSYDLEVALGKYMHALRDGAVPLLLLFSGTVFHQTPEGLRVEQISWDREAAFDLPVAVWTAALDSHHPGTGWLRVRRDTIDALHAYKSGHGLATWDDALVRLLEGAPPPPPPAVRSRNGTGRRVGPTSDEERARRTP